MNDEKRFELYEKLYFHEVEVREKISSRLQIPLALVLSFTSVYAFLFKGISFENNTLWNVIFGIFFIISLIVFITSVTYFIRSFYGHTYQFIPSALETEKYREELIETYESFKDCDELVEKYFNNYIFKYYNECSSANTVVNDKRSEYLHKCNTYLILTAIPLVIAFFIFTLSSIDKNLIDKEHKVKIINPINFKHSNNPIKINGNINTSTLEIDFSEDIKELINERQEKTSGTTTPSTTSSKKDH